MVNSELREAPLGKASEYISKYSPKLLFSLSRQVKRAELGIHDTQALPFYGTDIWNAYELSWLNAKGKPMVALGRFNIPATSPYLIESKSFKLYLNSFNNTVFDSIGAVMQCLQKDLSHAAGETVGVRLQSLDEAVGEKLATFSGKNLDDLDVACTHYYPAPDLLRTHSDLEVEETLYSNLLKSNCLVTGQPDWGSVSIIYQGAQIDPESLLRYLVSFRNHNEFHEQCVERIYMDIMRYCKPQYLTVEAHYTRRGGLDINPLRSSVKEAKPQSIRMARQ